MVYLLFVDTVRLLQCDNLYGHTTVKSYYFNISALHLLFVDMHCWTLGSGCIYISIPK